MNQPAPEGIRPLRYQAVYNKLRSWILDGTYPPGSKLPSEAVLCEQLGVSKITTGKAMNLLVQENLLVRIQGKGTFVVEDLGLARNVGDMDQLIRRIERLSRNSRVDGVKVRTLIGDEGTCSDLQIPRGSSVQEVSYVRLVDDSPIGYRISHIPLEDRLEISESEVTGQPIWLALERKGVPISGAHHFVGACLADSHTAKVLNTAVGTLLVRIRLIVLDEDARPIERSTAYYLADRFEHHMYLLRHQRSIAVDI
jgi:GntR family transcriptional regulator